MYCPNCRHETPAGAKFCLKCGARLTAACVSCGSALPDGAKFCPECGHAAGDRTDTPQTSTVARANASASASQHTPEGERRQATVLVADISGYTELCARMDPEHVQALLTRFYDATDRIIAAYRGRVIDHAGDGVLAVFGAPVAHGNDPERAIRAAFDLHAAARQLTDDADAPVTLHIGVARGEVVAAVISGGAESKYSVTGETVNLAARLNSLAQAGETVISDALHQDVFSLLDAQSLGEKAVKGFGEPVAVWRVHGLRTASPRLRPFVGRDNELRQLASMLESVRQANTGATVALRGEPGIGKSRLVEQTLERAQVHGYACHVGRVFDFGVGKGQDAVSAILKEVLGIDADADESVHRQAIARGLAEGFVSPEHEVFLNDLLDLEQPPALQSLFDAMDDEAHVRRTADAVAAVVKQAARRQPRLIVVEDIHWASAALLACLASMTAATRECPLLLIMTTRADDDPLNKQWRSATHGSPLTTIDLGPLRTEEAMAMAGELIQVSNRFALECIARAEGNPLFLEQLLRNARESEASRLPPTIQSLVLARVDRLQPDDKLALQAAAVLGKRFALNAVRFLMGNPGYRCDALVAADLVRPEAGEFLFAHALIQEGVYSSLLNTKKREHHRKAAEWFGAREPVLRAEHLDRAEDPAAGSAYLDAAVDQAGRFHHDAALRLADRGLALAADDPARKDLASDLALLRGDLLREVGRVPESIQAFRSALERTNDDAKRYRAWMGIASGYRITGDLGLAMDALGHAQPIAERLESAAERSRVHHLRGNLHFASGRVDACLAEHEAALALARQAGDLTAEAHALSGLGDAAYAQGRVITALEYFRRSADLCRSQRLVRLEIPNRCMLGHCHYFMGNREAALEEVRAGAELSSRVGLLQSEVVAQESLGLLLAEFGHYDEGEKILQNALRLARMAGNRRYESVDLVGLAFIRGSQGDRAAARDYLTEALKIAQQTGMAFIGPSVLGGLALTTDDLEERARLLREGEAVLRDHCLAHAYLFFHSYAIDAALASRDWDAVLRYADNLEEYVRPEPIVWARFVAERGRALAALGRDGLGEGLRREVSRLRDECMRAGYAPYLPAIDAATGGR